VHGRVLGKSFGQILELDHWPLILGSADAHACAAHPYCKKGRRHYMKSRAANATARTRREINGRLQDMSESQSRTIDPEDSVPTVRHDLARGYRSSWFSHPNGRVTPGPYGCLAHTPADAWQRSGARYAAWPA